jgi:hypothetical protein
MEQLQRHRHPRRPAPRLEAYCRDWVRASPNVARFSVDATKKVVDASAFISWTARAHFVDDKHGCVLE